MENEERGQNTAKRDLQAELSDSVGAVKNPERRRKHPGILSKLAAGAPEDTALAVLKGELALPVPGLREMQVGETHDGTEMDADV